MVARKLVSVSLSIALSSAALAQSWDLATDWSPPANPNGAWTYGSGTGAAFSNLVWSSFSNAYVSGGSPFMGFNGNPFYLNGIAPGQVWLNASFGTADARWTAPNTGKYDISLAMGGPLSDGGSGNKFAYNSSLSIDGVVQTGSFDTATNVMTWVLTSQHLAQGTILDAFVSDPGGAGGGETQTVFQIAAVPEPAPLMLLGVLLLKRRHRSKRKSRL